MNNIIISLDCSFTRTGICIINTNTKEITFDTASEKIGEKQFENVYQAAKSIVQQLSKIFSKYNNYDLIMESPLPCSSMSPALYALDTLIYDAFFSHIVKTYNPSTLRSRIHCRKYEKKDSQNLANKYIDILKQKGYNITSLMGTKRVICHDCSEAFLYIHLYLHETEHKDFQFDNSEDVKLYKQRMLELKKREKELLKENK